MASVSKEEQLLKLILENSPLKEWHFEEFIKTSGITRAATNKWLKRYLEQGLLKRVKQPGKFPYFTAGQNNTTYLSRKRLYSLEQLYKSGLIEHLLSLKYAKTVIIFGSIPRGDWYKDSDIDLFIYGDAEGFNKQTYERKLGRAIEVHEFNSKKELREVKSELIKNVMNGYIIKGDIADIALKQE